MVVINGDYKPNEKNSIKFEIASSKNDKNLFSNIDDNNNNGVAAKASLSNQLIKKSIWEIYTNADLEYINKDFQSIEIVYNPEFNRDWNLDSITNYSFIDRAKNQLLFKTGINIINQNIGEIKYNYENLKFEED